MNSCRQIDALIARRAQLMTHEVAELEAHLAGCDSCRELARAVKPLEDDFAFAATNASDASEGRIVDERANASPAPHHQRLSVDTKDRYQVTGEVGHGGVGRVLRAVDQVLERPVALKELFTANEAMRRRFLREALITARLQHPSIVPVYDAGRLGDRSPFYTMGQQDREEWESRWDCQVMGCTDRAAPRVVRGSSRSRALSFVPCGRSACGHRG